VKFKLDENLGPTVQAVFLNARLDGQPVGDDRRAWQDP